MIKKKLIEPVIYYSSDILVILSALVVVVYLKFASIHDPVDLFSLLCDASVAIIIFSAGTLIARNSQLPKKKDVLVIGFSFLYFSLLFDALDDVFVTPDLMKQLGGSLFQVIGYCLVFMGIFRWLDHNEKLQHELIQLSTTDSLTGVMNRRAFVEQAEREIRRASRHQHEVALILIDIDFFKKLNDNHGHNNGDKVLRDFAVRIIRQLRENDLFCRWGGEEFLLLVTGANQQRTVILAEKLRQSIAGAPFQLLGGDSIRLTASFGCAMQSRPNELLGTLVDRADQGLYYAKENGRNQVRLEPHISKPKSLQRASTRSLTS